MKRKRDPYIELIRLVCCLLVLLYHVGILKGGYLPVAVFFVLSGYFTLFSLWRKKDFSLKDHYLKRLRSIYLPLAAVSLCSVALISLLPSASWINLKKETLSVLLGYNNFWQLSADQDYFVRHNSSPFMHMWYIAILLQYELLMPLLVKGLKKLAKNYSRLIPLGFFFVMALISYIVFVIHLTKGQTMLAYYGSFDRLFSYFAGCLVALIHIKAGPLVFGKRSVREILYGFYLLLLFVLSIFAGNEKMALTMGLVTLLGVRVLDNGRSLFDTKKKADPILLYLASLSYEIYLVQYPLIFLFDLTRLPIWLKAIFVIVTTLVAAVLLKRALMVKRKDIFGMILASLIALGSVFGFYRFLAAKDYSKEMKELEDKLSENAKLIEEKNKEYEQSLKQKEAEIDAIFESVGDEKEAVKQLLEKMPVVGIGDSILIDVADAMYERFPSGYFDGKISRDLYAGNEIMENMKAEGTLSDLVILSLSVNGDYVEERNAYMMEILEDREVFWIDAVGADDPEFNERFEAFAQNYPNLHIVRWNEYSQGHPEYFYYDGIHVMEDGIDALADLIYDTVYNVYLDKYEQIKADALNRKKELEESKIVFYGNDLLINAYSYIAEGRDNAVYHNDENFDFDSLYAMISESKENGTLEKRIVLVFDRNAGFKESDYRKLAKLCEGHEVYICDAGLANKDLGIDNVTVVDLYGLLKEHEEYLMADKIHLSPDGSKAMADLLFKVVK
ncbi:MAG: acyltransferase family protein [Erysipelotrichaceae bacterium]|nr:acyltransferase family protein [Erysipelotrichaceae bacterium]